MRLNCKMRVPWTAPRDSPAGFETLDVYAGRTDASSGSPIEAAIARWTGSERAPREASAKLHHLRFNKRSTPLVPTVEFRKGTVVTFGPHASAASLEPLSGEQPEQLVEALRNEPPALVARARPTALSQSDRLDDHSACQELEPVREPRTALQSRATPTEGGVSNA